jgi:hypothetical protein
MSVLEKLKALDEQRAQFLEGAKKEALEKAEKALAELNELGFDYSLVEGASSASTARAPRKPATQAPKRQVRDLPCPICEFKTTTPEKPGCRPRFATNIFKWRCTKPAHVSTRTGLNTRRPGLRVFFI